MIGDLDIVLDRIRGEFLEMPGLRVTATEVARLCGLPREACQLALERLVNERFLRRTTDGTFVRDGQP